MESSEIISKIEEIVKSQSGGNYSKWIPIPPTIWFSAFGFTVFRIICSAYPANSKDDADKVESYFLDKGMRQDSESYGSADFVYIFYIGSPQETV